MIPGWVDVRWQDLLDDSNILTKPLPIPYEATFVDVHSDFIGNIQDPQYLGLYRGIIEFEVTDGYNAEGAYGYKTVIRFIETHGVAMIDWLSLWPAMLIITAGCPYNGVINESCPTESVYVDEGIAHPNYVEE